MRHFKDVASFIALPGLAKYHAAAMESMDQLQATYAVMTEDELVAIASDAYGLTDEAQMALRAELSRRGLSIELKNDAPQSTVLEPVTEDEVNDNSDLVVVASPRSRNDAAKIQAVLNARGVRSCLGPDNADNVESFHGTFAQPVDLKVYFPYSDKARGLIEELHKSIPPELEYDARVEDQEGEEYELESDAPAVDGGTENIVEQYDIRCPKCHSDEVVFENRESGGQVVDPEAASEDAKYNWHCDACGYQWQDDGVEENSDDLPVNKG